MSNEEEAQPDLTELAKARAKINAVEKVMGFVGEGEIYDRLHDAIFADQWEQSTHDEQRDEIAALKDKWRKLEDALVCQKLILLDTGSHYEIRSHGKIKALSDAEEQPATEAPETAGEELITCDGVGKSRKQQVLDYIRDADRTALAAAQAEIARLSKPLSQSAIEMLANGDVRRRAETAESRCETLTSENKELSGWKESALTVFNSYNAQNIAKLLGMKLGADIMPNVEPEIVKLKQERDDLKAENNEQLAKEQRVANHFAACIDQRDRAESRCATLEKALAQSKDALVIARDVIGEAQCMWADRDWALRTASVISIIDHAKASITPAKPNEAKS